MLMIMNYHRRTQRSTPTMATVTTATRRMLIIATTTAMMTMTMTMILLLSITDVDAFTSSSSVQVSIQPRVTTTRQYAGHAATQKVMSEMDIMCLENAAELCSLYDECDLEEREAMLTRFQQQTEIMADRIATMQALVKHLKTGDHEHLNNDEVALFTNHILELVDTEVNGIATTVVNGADATTTTRPNNVELSN